MKRFELHIWGFPPESLTTWPEDLDPIQVDLASWPAGVPVVVYGSAWETFRTWYDTDAPAHVSDVALYLPPGMEEPEEAWAYFDEVITARGEALWETFRDLVKYPKQYQVKAWIEAVPDDTLQLLHRPGHAIDYEALSVPDSVRDLLRDPDYRDIFREALEKQLQVKRLAVGFSEEQLEDYVQGRTDEETRQEIEAFLPTSPLARASLAVLHDELTEPLFDARLLAEASLRAFLMMVLGRVQIKWEKHLWRQRSAPTVVPIEADEDLAALVEIVRQERSVLLDGDKFRCEMAYDAQTNTIEFFDVFGAGLYRKYVFWVDLRSGEETLRSLRSTGGRVTLSLDLLENELARGANRLAITAA